MASNFPLFYTNNVNHLPLVMLPLINYCPALQTYTYFDFMHASIKSHNLCCCVETKIWKFGNGETMPSGGPDGGIALWMLSF